jgi:hypothetical protein
MPFKGDGWNWHNVAIGKWANPDYNFLLPSEFVNAKERFIVIRQVKAMFTRTTEPFDEPLNDCYLVSDLVEKVYLPFLDSVDAYDLKTNSPMGYVCMCNDANQKKKRYKYVWKDQTISFAFVLLNGTPILPSQWLIDISLVYR